ncbi:MAG: hypothetical protein FWF20_00370 [Betaproteobacteria bacterium]|nr:hypothetical protein [Betaproteobacteria bacterium]MCL2885235.1 hypothetical protein [Betaproteobacteria bacterium]
MKTELFLHASKFQGFNDRNGIFLCGYEWGGDDGGDNPDLVDRLRNIQHTFSNKALANGNVALNWKYDRNIIKWFRLWGHPLSTDALGGDFEKTIVQNNWCDTQAKHMKGVDISKKLLEQKHVDNFLSIVEALRPKVIFLFGIRQIECLQSPKILSRLESIVGKCQVYKQPNIKPFPCGRKFRVGFQTFENVEVVGLPHPSGSIGMQDDYIASFKNEIGGILSEFKKSKGIKSREDG